MANTTKFNVEVGMQANKQEFDKFNKDLENLLLKIKQQANAQTDPKIKKELNEQFKIIEKMAMAYEQAFDNKAGQVSIQKLTQEMQKANVTAQQFYSAMSKSGQDGAVAYNQWANSILNANIQLKQSNQLLDRMAVTLKNTVRYGISSSIFNNFTNSIQKAYNYTKNLDTSLNDIRIVSNQSADQMERLAVSANRAARELGKTTLDYTKAATIYYQQGLSSDEVEKRTEATLKAANVTGQNAQEVSEQLTAVWNGYRVTGEELELYVDKLAAVAASSASDLEELSTGMSKVASAANLMGVDIDQLNAQMSTIISVTRQAPESVGTALRTIYARIADIKAGLDDDTSLGNYSGKMAKLGFNVLDASGNLKDMGDVIEEIGGKWQDLSREQQISLAQTMAGTRQYNNLLTLFDNWDKYTAALETSKNAAGELQRQQDIYMESTAAHLQQLQATAEETYSALFDQESARDFIDLMTNGLSTINKYLNGLNTGALGGVLGQLGLIGANVFSGQIASGISGKLENNRITKQNEEMFRKQQQVLAAGHLIEDLDENNKANENLFSNKQKIDSVRGVISPEQYKELIAQEQELYNLQRQRGTEIKIYQEICEHVTKQEEMYKDELAEIDKLIQKGGENRANLDKEESARLDELLIKTKSVREARAEKDSWTGADADQAQRDATRAQEIQETIDKTVALKDEQKRINDIVRGTTALLGTWNNLQAGINIITDDSLSSWEKFQGLIGVAISQSMLFLTSADSLSRLLPNLVVQFGLLTKEEATDLTLKKLLTGETFKNIAANLKKIITDKLLTAGVITQTEAENGYNIALAITKLLTADVSGLSLLAVAAIVALTAAVVAGTAAFIDANTGINYYNKQIDIAKEKAVEAKEKYQELADTISNYKEARAGIDNLTEGTIEYYDAIIKANEEAQKLIDTFGLIAGKDYSITKGGLISIDESSLVSKQFEEQQKIFQASILETQARLARNTYNREKAITDMVNASGEKTGYTYKLSREGAEQVLSNQDASGKLEKDWASKITLGLWEMGVNALIDGKGYADLTDAQGKYQPVYNQAVAEAEELKRTLADQVIRGYASQLDVETYNKMTSEGQKLVQDYVQKEMSKSANKNYMIGWAGVKNATDTMGSVPLLGDLWKWLGETYVNLQPNNTAGRTYAGMMGIGQGYSTRAAMEKAARSQKAEDLGYTYQAGIFGTGLGEKWFDKFGRDVTEEVKNLDVDQIINEQRTGTSAAEAAAQKMAEIYSKSMASSLRSGRGADSQKYIANAMMAMAQGRSFNASLLNEADRAALLSQMEEKGVVNEDSSQGFTADWYKGYLESEAGAFNASARSASDNQAYNQILADQAEQLDTTKKALEIYGAAMANSGEITRETNTDNAEAIANSFKFNKAYNDAVKTYNNNVEAMKKYAKAMKENKKIDYETAEAVGEVAQQLEEMGLSLSAETISDHAKEINTLLTGTEEEALKAYEKLYELSQINAFESTFGDKFVENNRDKIQSLIDMINNVEFKDGQFGKISDDFGIAMQEMTEKAGLTFEQIQALGQKLGIEIPVSLDTEKTKNFTMKENDFTSKGQVIYHKYSGTMPDPRPESITGEGENARAGTVKVDYEWTETTQDVSEKVFTPDWTNVKVTQNKHTAASNANFTKAPSNSKSGKKSGSKAKPSKKDPNKQELDRYQLVNVQLKEISKELTKLDKQKKKLLGGNLVKNLNQQIKLLNDQIDVTEAKLKIAEKERAETAKTLSGYGAKFDTQGNVYNYETIFKQEQARLNKVYAKYNKMSKPQQEKYESTVKAAEERFKKFNDTISRYNTLNGDFIPGLEQDIIDAQDKITENLIEEFNMEIKVRLDLADAKREWNEFTRKYLKGWKENDVDKWASGVIDDLSLLINGDAENGFSGTLIEATNQLSKFQAEFEKITSENKAGDWYRDNAAQFKEDWKNAIEDAQEEYKRLQEAQDKMNEYFLQAMDLTQEKFDEQLDNFEAINKQIEHNLSLIDLLYGEDSYDKIEEQQKASRDNSIEQLAYLKQQKDYYDDLLATLNEEDEAWQEAKEGAQAANEALMEGLTNALEKAKEAFESGVAAVIKDMTDTLTNGKGFDLINKQWELMNENSELELDNINRMQGLQNIAKKYNDAINNTSNAKAQKELAEIRDKELEQLKEIDHLSQEDLERAEKKLEIAKAQIALEDAQQNKTQMRLRRDSQGNYRYQFVANEDQVNQARDQLAAAYNSLYNFDKERALQNNQEMISTTQQYFEEIANLRIRYGDDEQKYKEEKRILDEQYNEKMAILEEHRLLNEKNLNESTFADLNNLYAQNANNYELMTDAQKAALNSFEAANQTAFDLIFGLETENTEAFRNMADEEKRVIEEELIPQWNSGVDEMINKLADEGGFEQVATEIWNDITEKIKDYFEAIEAAEETSGKTFEELLGSENSIVNQNKEWIESNKDLIQTFIDMTGSVEEFYNELSKIIESYGDIIEKSGDVIKTNQDLYDQFTTEEADSIRDTLGTEPTTGGTGAFNQPVETTPTTTTKTTSTKPSIPFDGTLPKGTQLYNASGGKYNKTQAARTVTVTAAVGSRYQVWGSTFNPHTVYIDKNAIKYDTGGYTGEWGNGGRLALLHQKELVLNRKDTANMLNAVEVLRGITDNIGADLLGRMANITAGGFSSAVGGNALEQNVHIEATFPGVKSSIEIQDALNNLVNMAAQRAQTR